MQYPCRCFLVKKMNLEIYLKFNHLYIGETQTARSAH